MSVHARFEADFSQFVQATKNAETALGKVEQGSARVGKEFARLEGGGAAGKMDKLAVSVGQADSLLSRFGLNIPPAVRGLLDLGTMAAAARVGMAGVGTAAAPAAAGTAALGTGATAAAVGVSALGVGLVAAGAGLVSFKITEKIADVVGWTDAVANATAKAYGWGDVAGQEAAAGQDILARASKTAGRAITDVGQAMAINQLEAERLIAKNKETGASMQQLAADTKVAEAAMVALSKAKVEAQERSVRKEHELTVALMQREVDNATAYAEMKLASGKGLATAQANSAAVREMAATFEIERLRAHQEWKDVGPSRARTAAAAAAPAPFGGVPFAMRTPESYGGFTLPGAAAALAPAPLPIAATSSGGGYGSARGFGAGPVTVYVSGLDPATMRQIADVLRPPRVESMRRW